jgi:hypothetical protein
LTYRSATGSRKSVENNVRAKLYENSHRLDSFFEATTVDYIKTSNVGGVEVKELNTTPTIYCTKPNELLDHIIEFRNGDEVDCILKIGIDGGGGFMKVCLNIQQQIKQDENIPNNKRSKLSDGIQASSLKDSGVKRLMILAIAPEIQENYRNVKLIWHLLQLTNIETLNPHYLATDLKLANIMLGLMAHGSSHPCSWCDVSKSQLMNKGELRTLANLLEKFWAWHGSGKGVDKAKDFGNCVHPPLFTAQQEDTKILDLIPPPELHLMIGPVNTLFNSMAKVWPDALQWAENCHVIREAMHSGSFTGNSTRKLLPHVDDLEAICPPICVPFVEAFRAFNEVVDSCYGSKLNVNYKDCIFVFKNKYLALNINVTPKVHAVFYHIEDFCEQHQKGLGQWSEQASEAVHADFSKTWIKYKVSNNHPNYSVQLLRAVNEYNARHL